MNRNGGFNPLNQFISPNSIQLAEGGETREVDAGIRRQTLPKTLEGIPLENLFLAVTPTSLQPVTPCLCGPEGVACDHTPSTKGFTTLNGFQEHTWGSTRSHLDPGGEWSLQIRGPALGERNQIGTVGCSLVEGGAIRSEHARIFAALTRG